MAKLEDWRVWKSAVALAGRAYRVTMRDPLCRHFCLSDQIRRAAISIPANIAEGYGLGTRKQLVRTLRIAFGSALELKTHLAVLGTLDLADERELAGLQNDCQAVIRMLVKFLKSAGGKL